VLGVGCRSASRTVSIRRTLRTRNRLRVGFGLPSCAIENKERMMSVKRVKRRASSIEGVSFRKGGGGALVISLNRDNSEWKRFVLEGSYLDYLHQMPWSAPVTPLSC
jgi:hypothetical protein